MVIVILIYNFYLSYKDMNIILIFYMRQEYIILQLFFFLVKFIDFCIEMMKNLLELGRIDEGVKCFIYCV